VTIDKRSAVRSAGAMASSPARRAFFTPVLAARRDNPRPRPPACRRRRARRRPPHPQRTRKHPDVLGRPALAMPAETAQAAPVDKDKAAASKAKHGHAAATATPAPRKVRFNVGASPALLQPAPGAPRTRSRSPLRRHAVPGARRRRRRRVRYRMLGPAPA
jgi:hypothetical protein